MLMPGWLSKACRYSVRACASAIGSPMAVPRSAVNEGGCSSASARALGCCCRDCHPICAQNAITSHAIRKRGTWPMARSSMPLISEILAVEVEHRRGREQRYVEHAFPGQLEQSGPGRGLVD